MSATTPPLICLSACVRLWPNWGRDVFFCFTRLLFVIFLYMPAAVLGQQVLLYQGNVFLVFILQVESGADVRRTTTQQELNSWSSICLRSGIRLNWREIHKNPATLSMHSCVTLFLSHHVKSLLLLLLNCPLSIKVPPFHDTFLILALWTRTI